MIYTITFNPAVDYVVTADTFRTGKTNRTKTENIVFGGKGVNMAVARTVAQVVRDAAMGQNHALRGTGRARRVDEIRNVRCAARYFGRALDGARGEPLDVEGLNRGELV